MPRRVHSGWSQALWHEYKHFWTILKGSLLLKAQSGLSLSRIPKETSRKLATLDLQPGLLRPIPPKLQRLPQFARTSHLPKPAQSPLSDPFEF